MKIAIISDGLAGFMLANVLSKKNHAVTLVDTDNQPKSNEHFRNFDIRFLPNTPAVCNGLSLLEKCFSLSLDIRAVETTPLTIDGGEAKPFVGFGDSRSSAVQPLSFYNATSCLQIDGSKQNLVELSLARDQYKVLPYAELTAIHFNGSRIEKITVNGQTDIDAEYFIYLNSPRELIGVLPQELIGTKTRMRIAKSSSWTQINLQLNHASSSPPPISDLLFLLSNQPEHSPCVGQFQGQSSVWTTFIPTELAEDPACVAENLKSIRKLVRKAFPEILPTPQEAVSVNPTAIADIAWVFENKDFMHIAENFAFSPRLAAPSTGFSQSVETLSRASISCYH